MVVLHINNVWCVCVCARAQLLVVQWVRSTRLVVVGHRAAQYEQRLNSLLLLGLVDAIVGRHEQLLERTLTEQLGKRVRSATTHHAACLKTNISRCSNPETKSTTTTTIYNKKRRICVHCKRTSIYLFYYF